MNGLELTAADIRAIRERVACIASDLEALAGAVERGDMTDTATARFLRDKVKELGGGS